MRFPKLPLLVAAVTVFSTLAVYAALDDPLYKLLPKDSAASDRFGESVATNGAIAIIGARSNDDNGDNSGSAYIFDISTGQQLFKLLPNDGAAFDNFGISVAISGTTAIVGAFGDDDNGEASGSAYLFDTTTGLQLAKLLPTDGATIAFFGWSVGISGDTAIVGADRDSNNGSQSGSAYLFDTLTGLQIGAKLLPNDGASGDIFGYSVAISSTTAIVGAQGDNDNGSVSGSAYLFDISTGLQIAKLLANDGAADDRFGFSVAISGTIAIVGASLNDDNGDISGSAYLFDTDTNLQIAKLLPNDGAAGDQFGRSVAISGATAIVGAWRDDDNGSDSGSAYLFDTTGTQISKLLPDDGAAGDWFGQSVAISGAIALVGAELDDDNGSDSGSVYLTAADADRDGLLDSWETTGIPYINGSGLDLLYVLPGADPNHKNLYVEVDLDISQVFPPASQQMVVDAFAQSPVSNPDGVSGVTLHILYDEDLIDAAFFTTFPGGHPDAGWAVEFDGLKAAHFGTPAERLVSDPAALLEAKAKAYRYCIFADKIDDGSLGTAELPGNDMFLTLGEFSSPPINTKIASTFMHEFGHTLGLGHGGGDGINGKPNYISIMNYMFTFPYNFSTSFWTLDYSRFQLPTLNESNLDETVGVNPSNISYLNFWAAHGYEKPDGGGGFTRGGILISLVPGLPIDWNTNGTNTDPSAIQDLNYMGNAAPFAGVSNPSYPQLLIGQDDWANLAYAIGTSGDFADFTHNTVPTDKPDQAMIDWINANIPLPPVVCLADTNGDSMVNVTDLLTLLGGWGPNVGHPADFNDDGNVNVTDLLALLAAWGVCP
ncbi:MAG: hypothetical protein IID30_05240 [Planctomycetes bacterium]|nr:hypothetical protein [Planctomycetota bacterium]